MHTEVRELEEGDIEHLVDYWVKAPADHLLMMGADPAKVPAAQDLRLMLSEQLNQTYQAKQSYCMIWLLDGMAVGHCNVNKIVFGEEASMHLHLWNAVMRHKGTGAAFVRLCLPYFFRNMNLKKVYSEPHADNIPPNRTLEKAGFMLVREYVTTPGWINFEQPVKRWEIGRDNFLTLHNKSTP